MPIEIQKIVAAPEEIMESIRSLYEISFPKEELRPFEQIVGELSSPGEERRTHMIAALDGEKVLGLSVFVLFPTASLGYLWFLCVDPDTRGLGLGGRLYDASVEWLRRDAEALGVDLSGVIFEVERLTTEAHPIYGDPHRRIRFYERLGARMIAGYDYHQPPIPPHGPVALQLMFHPMAGQTCDSPTLARVVSEFLRLAQGVEDSLEGCSLGLERLDQRLSSA
ncbi:MAG: GNAT family N-acetyltransferase [Armatimonadetes bacterium]|nr:GNAT family N-acetyltransferase [Armatimonadota bacterium]